MAALKLVEALSVGDYTFRPGDYFRVLNPMLAPKGRIIGIEPSGIVHYSLGGSIRAEVEYNHISAEALVAAIEAGFVRYGRWGKL